MPFCNNRPALLAALAFLATSACSNSASPVPPSGAVAPAVSAPQQSVGEADTLPPEQADGAPLGNAGVDNTSILNKLTKDVVIGSTVDPTNGDTGPRALSRVFENFGLKKGQLLVCNFADSSGAAGKGTTIEVLDPTPGSAPKTFAQSSQIEGCDGDAVTSGNDVYGAGFTSDIVTRFDAHGKAGKTYGTPIEQPMTDGDAYCSQPYAPESMYVADAKTGSLVKFATGNYGNPKEVEVVTGFGVNKASGWAGLGPSGLQYDGRIIRASLCTDKLYVVDGVDNTIVVLSKVSNLLTKDEIVVQNGGKKFKCKQAKFTCGSLLYSGAPLDAPFASALLPNGNLIVANTKGNRLVEITSSGKLLATKSVDKSTIAHVFGLAAAGTDDGNTVLFYTTTKDNTLHELEQ